MTVYSINYDLRNPGRDYERLHEAIKTYGTWAHPLDSMWIVDTQKSAVEVRDHLLPFIDKNDGLAVAGPITEAAWYSLSSTVSDWLKKQLASLPANR